MKLCLCIDIAKFCKGDDTQARSLDIVLVLLANCMNKILFKSTCQTDSCMIDSC